MSIPSNPQSVQQPENDQAINDEVIDLAEQADSSSDEEMTDTESITWRISHIKRLLSVGWKRKSVGGLMFEKLSLFLLE
jgi:hypothetical protein